MKAARIREDKALKKKAIREGRAEGMKEAIKSIVKNMLKENQDESTIMRYTNVSEREINEIRREIQANS